MDLSLPSDKYKVVGLGAMESSCAFCGKQLNVNTEAGLMVIDPKTQDMVSCCKGCNIKS